MEPKKMISFRLNQDVIDKIKLISKESGLSQAKVLELAIVRFSNEYFVGKEAMSDYLVNMATLYI